ncbi:Alpha/Beta hydrolase protein [Aspergillus keveii]|uniref:Alpha/Beta hydrolase protein n=1 Tax=Aspergillus keveii TaxID=714993 RepID=A0ABR4FMQ8_9EURO
METPEYTPIPERAAQAMAGFIPSEESIDKKVAQFAHISPRDEDKEGDTEVIDGVTFTHHFVDAPGDYDVIRWHYVEAGVGEAIVFLHGIPDSWYQWHPQMVAFASSYRCIAVDLKGYGQSEKSAGDYRHEGAAEELYTMLQQIGVTKFNIVGHDRGSVQADFIAANHPESVLRYGRGEQHLYHFNPVLAPQEALFRDAPWTGAMEDPKRFAVWVYTWITNRPISDEVMARVIQEYAYPGIVRAVPRYFNSSTFRQEWLTRRRRLLKAWTCPVVIMQGYGSKTQPREFYEKAREYIPNAKDVAVHFMPGGHFWTLECPDETTEAIRHLLTM